MSCCECNGTCNHIGPHAFCYAHSPNGAPPPVGMTWTSAGSTAGVRCGGCRDLGAHVRWCPEVVGPRASKLGRAAERAEALADEVGASSPQAANDLYRVAAYLRAEATP